MEETSYRTLSNFQTPATQFNHREIREAEDPDPNIWNKAPTAIKERDPRMASTEILWEDKESKFNR